MNRTIPRRICRRVVALGLVFALLCTVLPAAGAVTQAEIDAKKSQQADLKSQIGSVQSQIDELEEQQDSAVAQAMLYQEQIGLLMEQINETSDLIAQYDEQIAQTQEDLAQAQAKSEEYYKIFCERVRDLEEGGEINYWAILFHASSFADLLDRVNFLRNVITYDNSVVDMLEDARQEVADTEAQLEQERSDQQAALEDLEQQQAEVQEASDKNDALLAQIVANQDAYADQLSQLEQENAALEDEIVADEAEYQAQLEELARQAAEEAARKAAQEEAARKAAEEEAARQAASQAESGSSESSSSSGSQSSSSEGSGSSSGSSSGGSTSYSATGVEVANYACQFLGNPYVWGGESLTKGCDCSGFVMCVYAHFGVSLPHSAKAQSTYGVKVSYSEAQPGDIIYYNSSGSPTGSHVGIYIGGGQMISALNSSKGICITVVNPNISGFTVRRIFT